MKTNKDLPNDKEAQYFARRLLMPDRNVRLFFEDLKRQNKSDEEIIILTAKDFGVEEKIAKKRLNELGFIKVRNTDNHTDLIKLGAKWLKKHKRNLIVPNCPLVLEDLVSTTQTGEIPDLIGFSSGNSVLIEVKISRSDFKRDFKKKFRINQEKGMGEFRYYLCPDGLIKESELPNNWGLLYEINGKIEIIKKAEYIKPNLHCERTILMSYIRRNK